MSFILTAFRKKPLGAILLLSVFSFATTFGEEAVIIMQNVDLPAVSGKKKVPIDELETVDIIGKKRDQQGNELFEIRTDRCLSETCVSGWVGKNDLIPASQFKRAVDLPNFEFSSCLGESCINYSFHSNGEFNYYYILSFSQNSASLLPLAKCADGDEEKVVELEKFCSGSGIAYRSGNFLRLTRTNGNLIEYLKYIPDQLITNRYESTDYFEALTK